MVIMTNVFTMGEAGSIIIIITIIIIIIIIIMFFTMGEAGSRATALGS